MKEYFNDNFDFFEEGLENLKMASGCPICNAKYNNAEFQVLEERNDARLVYIRCNKCRSSVVAVFLAGQAGISSIGMVTDLTSEDVLKFKEQEEISANDVLEVHKLLKSKNLQDFLDG